MQSPEEKQCLETWGAFFGQFGAPDPYTKIVLEVFFEELYGTRHQEAVSISGETGQEGSGDTDDLTRSSSATN